MELDGDSDRPRESTRSSPLEIDLNEIPTSSDAFEVVRTYHAVPDLPIDPAAELVTARGSAACGACGEMEGCGRVVVCDGCERGFHLGCTGMRGPDGEEWVCGECRESGVLSQRWPLGFKQRKKRVFDMNASPPSDGDGDGDGDGNEELMLSRKRNLGDFPLGGNQFASPERYSFYKGSGFALDNVTTSLNFSLEVGPRDRDTRGHAKFRFRNSEAGLGSPVENMKNDDSLLFRIPHQNRSEILLLALKDYISQRHGVLEEGWHVELKESSNGIYPVFYSPSGIKFGSMSGVASYLGLTLDRMVSESTIGSEGFPFAEKFHVRRRRKSARSSLVNGFTEIRENSLHAYFKECSSDWLGMEVAAIPSENMAGVTQAGTEEYGIFSSRQHCDGLPVQFEDFFLLSLGKIDLRPSYHSTSQIWPVGYRSCWHDKITGSLFFCEVSSGGDAGPAFKIRRSSCSAECIPCRHTILFRQHEQQAASREIKEVGAINCKMDLDNDESILTILSDPSPPTENDIATCLAANNMKSEFFPMLDKSGSSLTKVGEFKDEIGEILVEESSSSLAWKKMSERLIAFLSDIQSRICSDKLFCKHVENGTVSTAWGMMDAKCDSSSSVLAKFHGWPFSLSSLDINDEYISAGILSEWLGQDRFGVDVEFVQEMIEQLPGVDSCSQYKLLSDRGNYSTLPIYGNGNLLLRLTDGAEINEEMLDGLFRRSKKARIDAYPERCPPPGTPISSKVPPELVGDLYQVWEVLWRFHEKMGLKMLFGLEELEVELINPLDNANLTTNLKMRIQGSNSFNSNEVEGVGVSSSGNASALTSGGDSQRGLLCAQTALLKEPSEANSAPLKFSAFCGVVLTKVHRSLLDVLIGELQSKVAALVDPNFDSGESKPKRGRKKDADSSLPTRRTKLNMLPINELSWPELARRYILAILAMDGNSESAEVTARESGKVFRCLQGDGGVLCGSLTGIAGMEADALLLTEASRKIFGGLGKEDGVLAVEGEETTESGPCESNACTEADTPDWMKALEPVKKLPTNVGARIRKCVNDALSKDPPEWAKSQLEHSISKEVYKGNASGPTKKAVLSVLADASARKMPREPDKPKKGKTVVTVSDIIMKRCRIVLRQAAAADDSRVFCNLLGRKLVNGIDNDDEGLLGSPAMVSRPLDFRTIDLRLAFGAYAGSFEAFLEDVRELWDTVRAAFGDQPELIEIADKLSQNFESLFEKEVIPLFDKLTEYKNMESLTAEVKKEINDCVSSVSVLPKAPWDDGVCKVCGVDKDDDSVLLCDTCDAEYHTYCLNPPLAKIPEGNWYCPSCVARRRVTLDASQHAHLIRRPKGKRYQGDVTCDYLEALAHMASVMEERDYWEFSVAERTFLMKFLCDELLNSALIRQHLEQCAETSLELQQKLRLLSSEWKTLRVREELFVRAAKVNAAVVDMVVEVDMKEGLAPVATKNGGSTGQQQNDRDNNLNVAADPQKVDKINFSDSDDQLKDVQNTEIRDSNDKSLETSKLPALDPVPGDSASWSEKEESASHGGPGQRPHCQNGSQSSQADLNSLRNEISHLEDSISSLESQLLKLSLRREFLGSDSLGRLYWAAATPHRQLGFIVDGSLATQQRKNRADFADPLQLEGSKARCPYWYESNDAVATCLPLICYQSDTEIEQLLGWLNDNDVKERAVKDAILHWRKSRFQDYQQQQKDLDPDEQVQIDNLAVSDLPSLKAAIFLERQYGPSLESPTPVIFKCDKKGKRSGEEKKLHRCECLEPVWSSRCHCVSCHKTFITKTDLETHNDGKCFPNEIPKFLRGKEISGKEGVIVEKSGYPGGSSKLVKYQHEGLVCPHDLEEISSTFITRDSNKELVQQIGLIGSNGVPSLLQCRSPLLDESTMMLISRAPSEEQLDVKGTVPSSERRSMLDWIDSVSGRSTTEKNRTKNANRALGRSDEKDGECSRDIVGGGCCVVPLSSLKPVTCKASKIWRRLKINLLDMEAAISEEAFRPSKANLERRCRWRSFVKSAKTIYEMIQATIVFEDMIKTQHLRNEWWYWSSWSAAAKTSTLSSLALRIYSLDSAILYDKNVVELPDKQPENTQEQKTESASDTNTPEKPKAPRKSSRKRKDPEG